MRLYTEKSFSGAKWLIRQPISSNILEQIFAQKNQNQSLEKFCSNDIKDFWPSLNEITDLEKGLNIVETAIAQKDLIGIVGDYDVDGSAATAMLFSFFTALKANFTFRIPNRFTDGYGVSPKILKDFVAQNVKIVITVDNGTTAYEAIDFLRKENVKILILDHHNLQNPIEVDAFINPCRNPESKLGRPCAAGLVFFFLAELNKKLGRPLNMNTYLDKAALATVCDFVPLEGYNRALLRLGLEQLNKNPSVGFEFITRNFLGKINAYTLGFQIGPLINAAGRFGQAEKAVQLMCTKSEEEARALSIELTSLNLERRKIDAQVLEEALKQVSNSFCIICYGPWHEGVIGIVASRIKTLYNRPVIIMSDCEEFYKASCRSVGTFNLASLIQEGIERKIIYLGGGHARAAGFTLKREKLKEFCDFVESYTEIHYCSTEKIFEVDALISLHAMEKRFAKEISKLGPFGSENTEPLFLIPNCYLDFSRPVGEKHALMVFTNSLGTKKISLMMFNISMVREDYKKGSKWDLLVNIGLSEGNLRLSFVDSIRHS